jgi:uncharacterized protein YjiS (DUF1127 family)
MVLATASAGRLSIVTAHYSGNRFTQCRDDGVILDCQILLIGNAQENCMSSTKQLNTQLADARAQNQNLTWVERLGVLAANENAEQAAGDRPNKNLKAAAFDYLVDGFALGAAAIYSSPWYLFGDDPYRPKAIGYGFDKVESNESQFHAGSAPLFRPYEKSDRLRADVVDTDIVDAGMTSSGGGVESDGTDSAATPSILFRWLLGLRSAATRFCKYVALRHAIARSNSSLMQLDDRILRDIGIDRGQIEYIVRYGRKIDLYR